MQIERRAGRGGTRARVRTAPTARPCLLESPPRPGAAGSSRGFDVAGGGGNRALQCLWQGFNFTSVDVRPCCIGSLLQRYQGLSAVLPASRDFLRLATVAK